MSVNRRDQQGRRPAGSRKFGKLARIRLAQERHPKTMCFTTSKAKMQIYKEKSMPAEIRENPTTHGAWCVIHPLSPEDSAAMTALRSAAAGMKGKLGGAAARGPFNGIMERVSAPVGVTFEVDKVGGISGWWARPTQVRKGTAILHLH